MVSAATASELRRALLLRAAELEHITGNLRGQLGASRGSLNDALLLAESLPELMRDVVEQEMTRISDPDLQIPILQPLLRHLNQVLTSSRSISLMELDENCPKPWAMRSDKS